jgi:DeoR/GlpR family transcriptional regulator of sugar metabolism
MKTPAGFLTVQQAAERLGVSPQRVRVLLSKRRLQGCLLPRGFGGIWFVRESLKRLPGKPGRPKKRVRGKAEAGRAL